MNVRPGDPGLPISALAAEELSRRPSRPTDYAAENRVLVALARELAASPHTILERLADSAIDLCRAHSAGFSLLVDEEQRFEWTAVVGAWAPLQGGGTPRNFGPCSMVLEQDAPLLFWHPERAFPYLAAATPAIDEGLLLPFSVGGRAVGTIWVMSHDSSRRFDAEDLRVMTSLATFASAAYQAQRDNDIDRQALIAQLQEQDRRKDEFLATLAHELRNPLAPIANSLYLMQLGATQPTVLEHARATIERQVKHMVRLVDDLLDISRITRNRIELRTERVSLASIVDSAVETSRPAIDQAKQVLDISLPAERLMVDGDPVRLAQALANILNNAAKYSEPGRRIVLAAERVDEELLVRIRDQGIGIAADKLTHVFDVFVQLDESLARAQGGLGIGLTLVKRLVEMHGGRVEARSDGPGTGSEFLVWLPIAATIAGDHAGRSERPGRADQPSRRVLIVDDNRDAAECLAEMLTILGHDVITAHDGHRALELAASFEPEIALLDLGMPTLNGYEIARRLRQRGGPRPFLVAVTGWGQDEDRRRSTEAGFDLHLVKPVEPSALEGLIQAAPAIPRTVQAHASPNNLV